MEINRQFNFSVVPNVRPTRIRNYAMHFYPDYPSTVSGRTVARDYGVRTL